MHYSNASILESVAADKQNPSLVCIAEHTYSVHLQPNAVCSFHSFSVQISILFSYLLHAYIYIYIPPSSLISLLYSAPYVYTPRIALLNGPLATALHLLRKCSATDVCPLQDMDSIPIQSSVIYWSRSFHHVELTDTCRPGYGHVLSALWVFAIFLSCMLYRLLVSI